MVSHSQTPTAWMLGMLCHINAIKAITLTESLFCNLYIVLHGKINDLKAPEEASKWDLELRLMCQLVWDGLFFILFWQSALNPFHNHLINKPSLWHSGISRLLWTVRQLQSLTLQRSAAALHCRGHAHPLCSHYEATIKAVSGKWVMALLKMKLINTWSS